MLALPARAIPADVPLRALTLQNWEVDSSLGQDAVRAVLQAGDGTLWIATAGGVFRYDGAHFSRTVLPGEAAASAALAQTASGEILAVTPGSCHRLRGWQSPVQVPVGQCAPMRPATPPALAVPAGFSGIGAVSGSYIDREGRIWLAGTTGIARETPQGTMEVRKGPELRSIHAFFEDREGNMWLAGEYTGLTMLRAAPFALLGARDGLSSSHVRAGVVDASGSLWLAGAAGIDIVSSAGVVSSPEGSALTAVSAFALARSGADIYAGTTEGLMQFRDRKKVRTWTSADGLPDDFVRSILPGEGEVWVGTRHGLARLRDGRIRTYSSMDGLGSDLVGALLRDRSGALLVATANGLQRLRGDTFVPVAGVPAVAVTALVLAADGGVWVGTGGSGLFHLDGGGGAREVRPAEVSRAIYAMLRDNHGHLWLRDAQGLVRLDESALLTNDAAGNLQAYRLALPAASREDTGHPSAWLAADGTVSFATSRGVVSVRDDVQQQANARPLAFVESVSVDGAPAIAAGDGALELSPGDHLLAIEFGSSGFASPLDTHFRYRLAGAENAWTDAGTARMASYAGLPPGTYRFEVAAASANGAWGPSAILALRKRAYFYQYWWFYLLLLLLSAALAYALYRLRVRYVQARMNAVLAERTRIAREVHDTLAQGYVAVGMQIDIVQRMLQKQSSAADAAAQLAETRKLVRENLEDARSSIWNLRRAQNESTLPGRLAAVQEGPPAGGPEVRLEVHGAYRAIDAVVEQELFRIAQEAIHNARRHARATIVRVALTYGQGMEMTILDNGCGLPGGAIPEGHYGIRGMQERAEKIGARFSIAGAPGQGTQVSVLLPRVDSPTPSREESA